MFVKKIVVVAATALMGLTMSVCCRNAEQTQPGPSQDNGVQANDPVVAELQSGGTSTSTNEIRLTKPSAVTCSGDQNHGGRLCCDATHCCINILGVINCKLPPPVRK